MTEIEVDGEDARASLVALVVTVVDILVDALEREAVRRMERGRLDDDEVERLGAQLAALEDELDRLVEMEGIEEEVARLRGDLDSVVADAVERVTEEDEAVRTTLDEEERR